MRLTPKEFALLEFFLRHPGRVLTRSQIIEAVWDFAYDGGSNVVDQYVKYLRGKIDIPFGRDDIETVRGMGYRLRLAAAFALAAAALFALGGWLFVTGLSSAQLKAIDTQLAAQLTQAGRYLPSGSGGRAGTGAAGDLLPGDYVIQVLDAAGHVRGGSGDAGTVPLVITDQLSRARHGRIAVTGTVDEESARIAVGGAVFTAVAGLGAYWLARSALSPVERLRRQVAAVSEYGGAPGAGGAAVEVPSTRDEIAALAGTMNDLLGRLHRALARQRAFVADASHELRNPLAVLQGELELAARPGRGPAELTAAVRSAHAEAERLARLTGDLLLLARSDEDRLDLRLERADIGALLIRGAEAAGSHLAAAGRDTGSALLERWLGQVDGRGGCAHPDGAVQMIRSARGRSAPRWAGTRPGRAAGRPACCPCRRTACPCRWQACPCRRVVTSEQPGCHGRLAAADRLHRLRRAGAVRRGAARADQPGRLGVPDRPRPGGAWLADG